MSRTSSSSVSVGITKAKAAPQRAVIVCFLLLLALHASVQIILSGLLQHGTLPGYGGQTAGSPIWNTLGNELSFANLYLTRPNAGYTAPFINSGNGAAASLWYELKPGTYEFYFFVMDFGDPSGEFGLNLFFEGDNTHPALAVYSTYGVSSARPVEAGRNTLALDGVTPVSAPSSRLSYTSGGVTVALTEFGFAEAASLGGPALDRIGNLDSQPDSALDGVGHFTLVVTPCTQLSIQVSELELCWSSDSNRTYQIEYRSTLTANAWIPEDAPIQGNGATNCVRKPVPDGEPQRFYRIRCLTE